MTFAITENLPFNSNIYFLFFAYFFEGRHHYREKIVRKVFKRLYNDYRTWNFRILFKNESQKSFLFSTGFSASNSFFSGSSTLASTLGWNFEQKGHLGSAIAGKITDSKVLV
jgi:hypothetical protein